MNKFILSLFLIFVFSYTLPAQRLVIDQGSIVHNKDTRECIMVQMEPNPKDVKEAWRDYIKDNYDVKLKGIGFLSNKDVLSAEAVTIEEVSSRPFDLYTEVVGRRQGSQMCVFAQFGPDSYAGTEQYSQEYERLRDIVESFLGNYLPDHYLTLVNESQENLDDLIEEQRDLEEDIEDNKEKIAKLMKENEEKARRIEEIKREIEDTRSILETRRDKLGRIDEKLPKKGQ